MCHLINIAVPGFIRVASKKIEKIQKYQDLARELCKIWQVPDATSWWVKTTVPFNVRFGWKLNVKLVNSVEKFFSVDLHWYVIHCHTVSTERLECLFVCLWLAAI